MRQFRIPVHKGLLGLLMGLAGAALSLALWGAGALEGWEAKSWDWRVALLARPGPATDRVVLVLLDQPSLDWAKREMGLTWPWPRELYGAVVDYCRRSQARGLGVDVLFTEPSPYGVEDDVALGRAMAEWGRVAGAVFLGRESGQQTALPPAATANGLSLEGVAAWRAAGHGQAVTFDRAAPPIPEVTGNAALLASVSLSPDQDAVYRRTSLFALFQGEVLPVMGLGPLAAEAGGLKGRVRPGRVELAGRRVAIDRDGSAILRFRGPAGTFRALSAAAVIQSEIRVREGGKPVLDPEALRDKYVLFGFTAPGLLDLRPTPVGGVFPGVEIQATVLDNLLSGDFLSPAPVWAAGAMVLCLSLSMGWSMMRWRKPHQAGFVGLAGLGLPVALGLGAYQSGVWLPMVAPEVAAASTLVLGLAVNYALEGRQKRFIRNAFGQYLSPRVIDQLISHPERLKLGGERKVLSIFFSDLQGFTSISEGLSPEDLTSLLNDYLTAMTDIIHAEDGTVDKYEGDAIIAFWNAPLDVPDHAARAVRTALRCQARLAELRPGFRERTGKDLFMRIGLNTGPCVVGNMGSHTRFDYTMLGDAVNLAARLEGVNKQFGTGTMISAATRGLLGEGFAFRELARVAVVGRKEPVLVFEPMFLEEHEARRGLLEAFARGLAMYYSGDFAGAAEVFASIADQDPPARSYEAKCRELAADPPRDWSGVWVMTSK